MCSKMEGAVRWSEAVFAERWERGLRREERRIYARGARVEARSRAEAARPAGEKRDGIAPDSDELAPMPCAGVLSVTDVELVLPVLESVSASVMVSLASEADVAT